MSKSGKTNRNKGNAYEVKVCNDLKSLGLVKTKTSRAASKLYDDCGVDHWGAVLPNGRLLLTQCKAGYRNNRPKADVEFDKQLKKLKEHFPEGSIELNSDSIQILFHKMDDRKPNNHLVTVNYNVFMELLKCYIEYVKTPI